MFADDPTRLLRYLSETEDSTAYLAPPAELWDEWALAARAAELALNAWNKAEHKLKKTAFAAYHAALDREEQAAAALAARLGPGVV